MRVIDKELTSLEALKTAKSFRLSWDNSDWLNKEDQDYLFDIIETALKRLENYEGKWYDTNLKQIFISIEDWNIERKKLKALEIIKEKGNFISFEYDKYDDKYYIYDNEFYAHNEITKEEYDLLKEVFEQKYWKETNYEF